MRNNGQQGWDWAWMYYAATVLLGLNEQEFWEMTPRKLAALLNEHKKANGLVHNEQDHNENAFDMLMQL